MLSQKELSKLDALNASIVYHAEDWSIVVHKPIRMDTVDWVKQFSMSTNVFSTLSEYINDLEWTHWSKKLEAIYTSEEEYECKLHNWDLV